jgi:hypothetical protein
VTEEVQQFRWAVKLRWPGADAVPIQTANQFLVQIDAAGETPDQIILAVGQVTPPVVLGTPEDRRAQMEEIEEVGHVRGGGV